jgi:glycosyltransferase involved in cell wall biosynthesis
MRPEEITEACRPELARRDCCVVVALHDAGADAYRCLESLLANTPEEVPIVAALTAPLESDGELGRLLEGGVAGERRLWLSYAEADAMTAAVDRALTLLWPADVALLSEPCLLTPGWLERMRDAARGDSNTATASALADVGGELALCEECGPQEDLAQLAGSLAEHTRALRPRLSRAVGPCVYVRREALELVGPLDERIELRWALEVDFAQRCLLSGLAHVAADDVVVGRLAPTGGEQTVGRYAVRAEEPPAILLERYPYLSERPPLGDTGVLELALEAARGPRRALWVTLDARALDGAITGTQVHILELILALAHTGQLRLRVLVREQRIDGETLALLRGLPATEVLAAEELDPATPMSTVFHRPQQTFSPGDVALALALGERFVLSQLDLIAYRNPGYFADAGAWQDYRRASRHGLSAAERVVVFSDHTRRELLCDALVDEQRIRVVAPGLDHRAAGEPQRPAALEDGGGESLADGFLLCLGTDFRHKNRVFALRLLASLREQHDWQGSLVLAGTHIPVGSSLELERAFRQEHPELRDGVVELGPVSEREKAWLIAHAGAVVYPSVYEGFGLVPFESALSGVPCVFAPQSSLAEEAPAGTAAIVPWDPAESAAGAHALLTDPSARADHVNALVAATHGLTWAAAASALVDIYREAALAPVRDAATLSRDAVAREGRLSVEHELEAARLVREREHARRMYEELNAEVGSGLSLIGPRGALPDGLQRALLALSARPALSRPLFGALSRAFLLARALGRVLGGRSRRAR